MPENHMVLEEGKTVRYFPALKYINLPNLITWVSFCIGIIAFIFFTQQNYQPAIVLYALTLLFDKLDGVIARKFGLASDFGAELDNLSDAINFALLPALIAYFMGFKGGLALCVLLLHVLSGVWRLANYSIIGLVTVGDKECFTGLCTTHAAALFLLAICIYLSFFQGASLSFMYLLFIATAVLMNSRFKYDKNGWLTKSLYILIPGAVILSLFSLS